MIATNRPKRKRPEWTGEREPLDDWQIEYLENQRQELMNLLNVRRPIMKYKECTIMNKEKVYLESAKKIVEQGCCRGIWCSNCASGNEFDCNELSGGHRVSVSMSESLIDRFKSYIAEHERKPAKSPVRKSVKRFHANGGTLGWKKEEVRYFIDTAHVNLTNMPDYVTAYQGGYMWFPIYDKDRFEQSKGETFQSIEFALRDSRFIEVTEADLDYLRKPDGDWELRKVEEGDSFMNGHCDGGHGAEHVFNIHFVSLCYEPFDFDAWLSGYRWCKPRKKPTKAECMGLAIEETWKTDCSVCYKRAVEIYERLLEENGLT